MQKIIFILLIAVPFYGYANSAVESGFQSTDGMPIPNLKGTWKSVENFFGSNMPQKIIVNRKDFHDGYSKFSCATNTVFINSKVTDSKAFESVVAHEGTHVVLCNLTREFNIVEKSRFWDEGLATLIQYRHLGKETEYKERSRKLALQQDALGNLKLSNIQNWRSYSRDEKGKINSYAYGVGSSFNYFLLDTFGEARFKTFLSDIGKTKDFNATVLNVFQKSSQELEYMWRLYIKK